MLSPLKTQDKIYFFVYCTISSHSFALKIEYHNRKPPSTRYTIDAILNNLG
jgi:hypothetical protein